MTRERAPLATRARRSLAEILECPFCAGPLGLEGSVAAGVLSCRCNAYPVVDGIPALRPGAEVDAALGHLAEGDGRRALLALLGIAEDRRAELEDARTFREALEVLCPGAEGTYLLFRFSDPTFVAGDALVRALGARGAAPPGRVLDLCGGAGHLTRSLARALPAADVVLADISFAKLWLARRFVAPGCLPVCCDANVALPFARGAFAVAVCSDAFHFVRHKRGLARELTAAVADGGLVLLPHLHNALSWNPSEGMPLAPGHYARLFGPGARLFPDGAILDAVIDGGPLDLARRWTEAELAGAPALTLVWSASASVFRTYERPPAEWPLGLSPLYRVEEHDGAQVLLRRFPSGPYEAEYEDAKRYLPERVELPAGGLEARRIELAERRVLLELPEDYL